MWFRRRKDHETIRKTDYCGKFDSTVPALFTANNCPGLKPISNEKTIGMQVGPAREHFLGFEFFETSENKPQPLFEEFKFLNDELFNEGKI